jgi:hypothetical protein
MIHWLCLLIRWLCIESTRVMSVQDFELTNFRPCRVRACFVRSPKPDWMVKRCWGGWPSLFMCLCLALLGCANSESVENRDYAFDTYYPTPNEIQLAQQRAQRYWQKNSQRYKNTTPYLAVYATSVVQGDVNQNLYSKLINSETTSSFFETYSSLNASCVMIYDTGTNRFVSNVGYASVDLPSRGSVARWDGYTARYIGWGG